jgi:hypothetical protein
VASDAFASNAPTLPGKDKTKTREISGTEAYTAVGVRDSRMIRRHVKNVLDADCFDNRDKVISQTLATDPLSDPCENIGTGGLVIHFPGAVQQIVRFYCAQKFPI